MTDTVDNSILLGISLCLEVQIWNVFIQGKNLEKGIQHAPLSHFEHNALALSTLFLFQIYILFLKVLILSLS